MKNLVSLLVIFSLAAFAFADWDVGDDHKMHFPQLPDPVGWDVANTTNSTTTHIIADDFQCSESGFITDFHLWGSWLDDVVGVIDHIDIEIWSDDPVGIGGRFDDNTISLPWESLWYWSVYPNEFIVRNYGIGDQGWYDPFEPSYIENDHEGIVQINIGTISNIPNPFWQEKDSIYWLSATVWLDENSPGEYGWKTSDTHWNDDAVFASELVQDPTKPSGFMMWDWQELVDPVTQESLDMAFVITPEPASLILLGLGGLFIRRVRK